MLPECAGSSDCGPAPGSSFSRPTFTLDGIRWTTWIPDRSPGRCPGNRCLVSDPHVDRQFLPTGLRPRICSCSYQPIRAWGIRGYPSSSCMLPDARRRSRHGNNAPARSEWNNPGWSGQVPPSGQRISSDEYRNMLRDNVHDPLHPPVYRLLLCQSYQTSLPGNTPVAQNARQVTGDTRKASPQRKASDRSTVPVLPAPRKQWPHEGDTGLADEERQVIIVGQESVSPRFQWTIWPARVCACHGTPARLEMCSWAWGRKTGWKTPYCNHRV